MDLPIFRRTLSGAGFRSDHAYGPDVVNIVNVRSGEPEYEVTLHVHPLDLAILYSFVERCPLPVLDRLDLPILQFRRTLSGAGFRSDHAFGPDVVNVRARFW